MMKPLYFIILILLFSSCKKEEPQFDSGTNNAINQWLRQTMDEYYYWNIMKNMGKDLNQNPLNYFKSLLSSEDRYSFIVQNMNKNSYTNNFETSFGFDFIQIINGKDHIAVISLIVPGSQADELGLKRGDTIISLNNIPLNVDISGSIDQLLKSNSIQVKRKDFKEFNIASAYIAQPILYQSNTLIHNNKTFGYLYISHFNFAGAYDLIREIQKFKSEGITELILDLRYNPGGQVSFASFCSMLFSKVSPEDLFIKMRGNAKVGKNEYTFAKSLSLQPDGYTFKAEDIKNVSLNLSKIFVISSKQSASASELIINNLKPYIDIIQVGETSMGKDMGSMSFSSPESVSGKNNYKWIIAPLVYKLYNAEDKGDYPTGIIPQILVSEISAKKLYAFGDARDPMINAILNSDLNLRSSNKRLVNEDNEIVYRSNRSEEMTFE